MASEMEMQATNRMPDENLDEIEVVNSDSSLELRITTLENEVVRDKFFVRPTTTFKPFPKSVVKVRNAVKQYRSGPPILNNLSMTVQKGTIYSLLGSSGCGKTTLLSCIVGVKHLNSGKVLTFGAQPGTRESGIPGNRVGYMPQETALYNEFTIAEAIRYFGTLYGMPYNEIQTAQDFLIQFLDLPDKSRRIGTLSGGQKRRVSLAVSLVHGPELLILDEPTVGVDPLLRESIWNHLVNLVSTQDTTVIVTTHYIEEARQSNTIGLMRGGRLLAEKSPSELLAEHNANNLEDIVLKLCNKDTFGSSVEEAAEKALQRANSKSNLNVAFQVSTIPRMSITEELGDALTFNLVSSRHRIKALIVKNLVLRTRNILFLVTTVLTPATIIAVVCSAIGHNIKPINVGFINNDINFNESCPAMWTVNPGCNVENLACQFMSKIPRDQVHLHKFETEEAAIQSVKDGNNWGILQFPKDYSSSIYSRATIGSFIDNVTLDGSEILVHMDMTSKLLTQTIQQLMYSSYQEFLKELLGGCGYNPHIGELPVEYPNPIYGAEDIVFTEFVGCSFLLGLMLFFPLCLSGVSSIQEKKQGTLERSMMAGMQTWEIMTSSYITESLVMFIQAGLGFLIIFIGFGIDVHGSLFLAMGLAMIIGYAGVSMGFLFATFCTEELEIAVLAIGAFFPCFNLSGLVWPLEGEPIGLQYFSYFLPITFAGESIRSIVTRGWGLTHVNVWPGFVVAFGWIIVPWILTIFSLRMFSRMN